MRLGLHIREQRRARKMSAKELGDLLGVKQSAVSKWENGTTDPSDDKLDGIAAFLGVTRAEVVLMRDAGDVQLYAVMRAEIAELRAEVERIARSVPPVIDQPHQDT